MHAKGGFEQVDELLAHLGVEARVGVREQDVLFRLEQGAGVDWGGGGCGGRFVVVVVSISIAGVVVEAGCDGVNVGPFGAAGPVGRTLPFLAQGGGEVFVGEEIEELCG